MRRHRLAYFLATVIAISMALVTLIGLVTPQGSAPSNLAVFLVSIVTVVLAIAVLLGLLNLFAVHVSRLRATEHGWPYSLVALLTAVAVIVLRILDRAAIWRGDLEGEMISTRVFEAVQVSLESALAALLVFFLVYAAYRLMRREVSIWSTIFILSMIVVLLGWIPATRFDKVGELRDWIVEVPVSAGARGILIGVGLGTVMVGIRVLTGQDRSIRG